jgi:copper chaperone CopZ
MKNVDIRTLCTAGLIGMYALAACGEYKQINMTVFGMDCPPCAFAVRLSMKGIQGVNLVDVDLDKGLVTVKLSSGNNAEMRQFNEAVEKNGFAHQDSLVLVQGVLLGSEKAPFLQVSGTKDRYALTPLASGVDLSSLLGKAVMVEGMVPQSARGKVADNLRYKTIALIR